MINATLHKKVKLNITAVDKDTITFRVIMINKPADAVETQSGNVLYFSWNVTSKQKGPYINERAFSQPRSEECSKNRQLRTYSF